MKKKPPESMVTRTPTRKSSKMHRPGRAVGDLDAVISRFFFSEDPMSIRCFTVITRVLLNKPHISESLFFLSSLLKWFYQNHFNQRLGSPSFRSSPSGIPLSPTRTVRKFLEQLALMLCILLIDEQTSSWFLDKMLGKAPCLTGGYPYNGNSY